MLEALNAVLLSEPHSDERWKMDLMFTFKTLQLSTNPPTSLVTNLAESMQDYLHKIYFKLLIDRVMVMYFC